MRFKPVIFLLIVLLPALAVGCRTMQSTAPTGVIVTPQTAQSPVPSPIANTKIGELEGQAASHPNDAEAQFKLGNAYAESGRYPEAEAAFGRVLEIDPDHVDARSNLGVVYYKQGMLSEAEVLFREVLAEQPDDAEILYNLGGALAAQNKLDQAVAEFLKANKAAPDLAQPYLGLGTVYRAQGKRDEAIAALTKYVELSDDPTWREQAKQMLRELGVEP